jgi:hypothetical protein
MHIVMRSIFPACRTKRSDPVYVFHGWSGGPSFKNFMTVRSFESILSRWKRVQCTEYLSHLLSQQLLSSWERQGKLKHRVIRLHKTFVSTQYLSEFKSRLILGRRLREPSFLASADLYHLNFVLLVGVLDASADDLCQEKSGELIFLGSGAHTCRNDRPAALTV